MSLNQRNDFVASVSLGPRVVEQFVNTPHHRAALGCSNNSNATTSCEVEQTFVSKDVQSANDRVFVYPEHCREVHRRRQTLTFDGLALGDGSTNLRGHLFVERYRIFFVDSQRLHSTILNSTINFMQNVE